MKDEELNKYVNKIIKEADLETPSIDFSKKVMKKIENKTIVLSPQKPIISSKFFIVIAAVIVGVLFVVNNSESSLNYTLSELIDFSLFKSFGGYFGAIKFSKTFIISWGFFAIFASIQMFAIKKYYKKIYN